MKWSNLKKNQSRDYEDEDAESSSDEEGEGIQETRKKWMPVCNVRTVSHAEGAESIVLEPFKVLTLLS